MFIRFLLNVLCKATLQILQTSFFFLLLFSTLKVLHERTFSKLKASRAKKIPQKVDFWQTSSPICTLYYIKWHPNSQFPNSRSFSEPQKPRVWRYYCTNRNKVFVILPRLLFQFWISSLNIFKKIWSRKLSLRTEFFNLVQCAVLSNPDRN